MTRGCWMGYSSFYCAGSGGAHWLCDGAVQPAENRLVVGLLRWVCSGKERSGSKGRRGDRDCWISSSLPVKLKLSKPLSEYCNAVFFPAALRNRDCCAASGALVSYLFCACLSVQWQPEASHFVSNTSPLDSPFPAAQVMMAMCTAEIWELGYVSMPEHLTNFTHVAREVIPRTTPEEPAT